MANEYTVERIAAEIVADTRDAVRALTAMEANLDRLAKDRTANVDVDLSDSDVKKTKAELDKLTRDRKIEVEVDLDKKSLQQSKGEFSRFQKEALSLGRMKLGGEFLSGLLKIPAALQGISVAASGIGSLAGGAAALAGSLQQLGTAALAAPAAITPLVGLMGSLKIATMGVGDAAKEYFKILDNPDAKPEDLEKLEKQFTKLSTETVLAVKNAGQFRQELTILSAQLQRPLFGTLNREMETFQEMFRKIQPGLLSMTQSFSDAIRKMATDLNSPDTDFAARFTKVLQASRPTVASFGRIITNLADVFLRLAEVAAPFLTKFVRGLEGMSARARGVTLLGQYTGELADKFEKASNTGQILMKTLSNFGRGVMNIFKIGASTGDEFLTSLRGISDTFLKWTQSVGGQNRISKYFEDIKAPLKEAGLLIGDLGEMFFKLDDAGRGPLTNIIRMLRTDLLPTIEKILQSEAGSGFLETMVSGLSSVAEVFATLKGSSSALTSTMGMVVDFVNVLGSMLDAIGPLAPAIGNLSHMFAMLRVVGVDSPVALGLAAITSLMTVLTGDARNATPIIMAFGAAWATVKVAQLIGQFQQLSSGIGAAAAAMQMLGGVKGAGGAAEGTSKLVGALGGGGGAAAAGGLTAATAGVAAAVAVAVAGLVVWQQNSSKAAADTDAMTASVKSLESAMADGVDPSQQLIDTLGEWVNSNEMTDDLDRANVSMKGLFESINANAFKLKDVNGELELTNSLHMDWTTNGQEASDMLGEMNGQLGRNAAALVQSGSDASTTARNIGHWADKMKDAYNNQIQTWKANNKLTDSMVEQALQANTNEDGFVDMNGVIAALSGELGVAAQQFDAVGEAQQAASVKALQWQQALEASTNMAGLFGDALNANFGSQIGAKLKLAEMTDGYKQLTDAIKEAKDKSVEGLTANTQVLTQFGNMRSGAIDFARGMVEAGFSVEQASDWLKGSFLPALQDSMREAGLSEDKIKALNEQLGLVDGQIDISIQVYKDELAKLKLTEIWDQLKVIEDEDFKAKIEPLLEQGKLEDAQALINAWVDQKEEKTLIIKGDHSQWTEAQRQVLNDMGLLGAHDTTIDISGDPTQWNDAQVDVLRDLGLLDEKSATPKLKADVGVWDAANDQIVIDLATLDSSTATPTVDANTNPFDTKRRTATFDLLGLNGMIALPLFDANKERFDTKADSTQGKLNTLNNTTATPKVDADTSKAETKINRIANLFAGLTRAGGIWGQPSADGNIFPNADGGIWRMANGGMTLPKRATIQKPVGSKGLFQWAEPETKGEAFIPLASSKRKRSREIWLKTGNLLGIPIANKDLMRATPMADGGITSLTGALWTINQIISRSESLYLRQAEYDKLLANKRREGARVQEFEDFSARITNLDGRLLKVVNADWSREKSSRTAKMNAQQAGYSKEFAAAGAASAAGNPVSMLEASLVYQKFAASSISSQFKAVEKVLTAMGGTKWKDFMTMITKATQQGQGLAAVGAVQSQYNAQTAFFNALKPKDEKLAKGLSWYGSGVASWLTNKGNENLALRAQGDYQTNAGNRKFTSQLLRKLQDMGAVVTETGYGEFNIDLSKTKNDAKIAELLDRLSTQGFGVSASTTQGGAGGGGERTAPYVLIQSAVFKDENDANMLGKKVEFAVRSERLGS